jgi:type I restriction enzyme R subunit
VELCEKNGRPDADPIDQLRYVAYNALILTRRERVKKLRQSKSKYFNAYGPAARVMLDELLNKYAISAWSSLTTWPRYNTCRR